MIMFYCVVSPDSQLVPAKVESVKKSTDSLNSCLKSVSVKHKDIHPLIAKLSRTIDKVCACVCVC